MAERLAALGLKPPIKSSESEQQKQVRETKEREERVRQAAAEDARRDQERQRRLAEEQPLLGGSKSSSKKPPPPPSRKSRADSVGQLADTKRKAEQDVEMRKAEQRGKEDAIKVQQAAQEAEIKALEYVVWCDKSKCKLTACIGMLLVNKS